MVIAQVDPNALSLTAWVTLHEELKKEGIIDQIALSQRLQFNTASNPFLGANLLPEVSQDNEVTEVMANITIYPADESDPYSPVPVKDMGATAKEVKYSLGNQDISYQMTANDIDTLAKLARNTDTGTLAIAQIITFYRNLITSIMITNERSRWCTFLLRQLERVGPNGYRESVKYPGWDESQYFRYLNASNPLNWYNDEADPIDVLQEERDRMWDDDGYALKEIYMDRHISTILYRHPLIAMRANSYVGVNPGSGAGQPVQLQTFSHRASNSQVNSYFTDNGLPIPIINASHYSVENGGRRGFMYPPNVPPGRHYILLVGHIENPNLPWLDLDRLPLSNPNLLGYFGIGKLTGERVARRIINSKVQTFKPMNITAQGLQKGLPIIKSPYAYRVIIIDDPRKTGKAKTLLANTKPNEYMKVA
ncbi:MAG: hypothetical protein F6K55_03385 [Moorea sp. SIO4A3]|nr:hypothetical protein [Moorena sp. SIO4A3]